MRSVRGVGAGLATTVALAGCGGGLRSTTGDRSAAAPGGHGAVTVATGERAELGVVRAWARALRRGDVAGAARLFAVPSLFVNGSAVQIDTPAEARAVNATLTCGALVVSATREGRYLNVLFRLTGRRGLGGTSCATGVGQTARTDFLFVHGKIAAWIRAPDLPPAGGGSPDAPATPPSLSTPASPGTPTVPSEPI